MAEKATTAPPFTVDNVLTAVQGVEWLSLGKALFPSKYICGDDGKWAWSYPELEKIEKRHQTDEDKLYAVIVTFVQGEEIVTEPSWRALIWRLDCGNMTRVADNIRHYAEPVLDPTLTVENVMEVMGEVGDWTVVIQLGVPASKIVGSQSLVAYWVSTDPDASWKKFGHALYKADEGKAAAMVKQYLPKDPTLTVENVTDVMGEVGGWEVVGIRLGVSASRVKIMQWSTKQARQSLGEFWVSTDPDASWLKLANVLYEKAEDTAAAMVKPYLPKADPTLTTENLMEVVKGVEDRWEDLVLTFGVSWSKKQEIKSHFRSDHQSMEAVVDHYVRHYPRASWKDFAKSLKWKGLHKQADEVTTKYVIKGEEEPSVATNQGHPPPPQTSEQLSQGVEEPSLSTDQGHPAKSSLAQQLSQAAARDRLLIQRHIEQQGSLKMNSHKVLLSGLPRTGKTTAMLRLSNQLRCLDPKDSPIPSTGFEKPKTVELYKKTVKQSVMITGVGEKAEWKYQNLEQQGQTLYSRILKSSSDYTPSPAMTSFSQSVVASSRGVEEQSLRTSKEEVDVLPSQLSAPVYEQQAVLTSLVKAQDWKAVREKLKAIEDVTILHMMDCGGHPECHEILPLLLEGRALSLLFLNLTHDLDKTYHIVFQGKEGPSSIEYESVFTAREVLQCILCSISSLQSGAHEERPVALLVGSYLDKTDQEAVLALDKSVQEALKSFIKKDILFPANVNEGKYIATLDNMSDDQADIEELRRVILTIIETRFQAEPIPTAWLMLHLLLRAKYENEPGWCTVEECVEVATTCGIESEELLKEDGILHYIHKHYGTLLYYPKVAGLCDRVICDPNIILHLFTQTFLFSFACNPGHIETAKSIRATGEIPHDLMESISAAQSADPIPTSEIIALLKDRYILYESVCTATGTRSYFMPCLLQPDPSVVKEASNPTTLSSINPAPLQLVPHSTGYVPLGLFPALVVRMSHTWNLTQRERFRNRIQFNVRQEGKPTRRVEFRQHPSYLELRLLCKDRIKAMDLSVLTTCRQQLWEALRKVSSEYPHMKDVVWQFGFYCPGGLQPGGQPHSAVCMTTSFLRKEVAPVDMECVQDPCCEEENYALQDKHKSWFKDQDQGGVSDPPTATDATTTPGAATQSSPNVCSPSGSQVITDAVSTQRGAVCSLQASTVHPLDSEDFLEISEYLIDMEKTGVYNLGLVLGLSQRKVAAKMDSKTFLDDVITAWLRKEDQVIKRGEPSWTVLVSALKHPRVGQTGIACNIAKDKGLLL